MKIREYIILKDKENHPYLEETRCVNWNGDLRYVDEAYRMLNEIFKMNKLHEEYAYVIALDHQKRPKGVCQVGHGNPNETPMPMQNIFTFLLLTGANAFIVAHNHVSNMSQPSKEDIDIRRQIENIAQMMDIEFVTHLIINPKGYISEGGSVKVDKEIEYLDNGKAATYIFGNRIEGEIEMIEQIINDSE